MRYICSICVILVRDWKILIMIEYVFLIIVKEMKLCKSTREKSRT